MFSINLYDYQDLISSRDINWTVGFSENEVTFYIFVFLLILSFHKVPVKI